MGIEKRDKGVGRNFLTNNTKNISVRYINKQIKDWEVTLRIRYSHSRQRERIVLEVSEIYPRMVSLQVTCGQ